jgi:hypothetical protein
VFALGCSAALAARFAGLISFDAFGLPALLGGSTAFGVVGLALSDYSRRPSFRVRRSHRTSTPVKAPVRPVIEDPVTMWTYTTRSA